MAWVKEGRKYDLGAVLITQQPGSISGEILSQGDNWFVIHLLSSSDLQALKRAKSHFSDDLLSTLLNEPLVGNGVFWSSAAGKSYPIPIRVLSFEELYNARDPSYELPPGLTFANELKSRFHKSFVLEKSEEISTTKSDEIISDGLEFEEGEGEPINLYEAYISAAINSIKNNILLISDIKQYGKPWYGIQVELINALPEVIDVNERRQISFNIVRRAMDKIFGEGNWNTEKRPKKIRHWYNNMDYYR